MRSSESAADGGRALIGAREVVNVDVFVGVFVGANLIVAALGNGNDIVGVVDLT